jgi:hypothetical protein
MGILIPERARVNSLYHEHQQEVDVFRLNETTKIFYINQETHAWAQKLSANYGVAIFNLMNSKGNAGCIENSNLYVAE